MGASKRKALTTITEYEEQELSLAAIEWLPESLQVRENLDKGWVLEYSRGYAKGDPFPPVLVYRLPKDEDHPDGRLVLADGFHRVDAARSIGLKSIRAQIREGTITDALLAAIEGNTATFHRGRKFEEADRQNAVGLMIRNEETRVWSDVEISRRCAVGASTVTRIRLRMSTTDGIPIPNKVKKFDMKGNWTGKWSSYRKKSSVPSLSPNGHGTYGARIGGSRYSFGGNLDKAKERLGYVVQQIESNRHFLSAGNQFVVWLTRRGIPARGLTMDESVVGGIIVGDSLLCPASCCDSDSIFKCIGELVVASKSMGRDFRKIVVGYLPNHPGRSSQIVGIMCRDPDPIEFMTPEELVAEFGPKDQTEPSVEGAP